MKPRAEIISAAQALRESTKLKRFRSAESRLNQRLLIYIASLLEEQRMRRRQRHS